MSFPNYSRYENHKTEHLEELTILMDLTVISHVLKHNVVHS